MRTRGWVLLSLARYSRDPLPLVPFLKQQHHNHSLDMSGGCEVESFAKLDRGIWWKCTYWRSCFFMPMHRWTGHLLVSWQRRDGRTVSTLCVGGYSFFLHKECTVAYTPCSH